MIDISFGSVITVILYALLAILVFGILIFIHELGHFVAARLSKVTIHEFAIGMGPTLFSWKSKKYDTKYAIRLFPIGGFVSMAGEDGESDDENAFNKKPFWNRFIILLSGPAMNIILGFILTFAMLFSLVITTRTPERLGLLASTVVDRFYEDAVSNSEGGLMSGDKILKVGNVRVHTGTELSYEIMHQGYKSVDLTVERNGQKITLENVSFGTATESGVEFGVIDFIPYGDYATVGNLIKHTFFSSCSMIKMVWDSIIDLITGRFGVEALSGPVGMTEQIGESAKAGSTNFLYLIALITINLGVMNLLPIPALDGGRLLFLTIEGITRKKINPNVESYIHFVGIILLFGLMIFITFKDILNLF